MSQFYSNPMDAMRSRERQDNAQRKLASVSISTSERIVYQCPTGRSAEIRHILFTSSHSGSESVSMWHVMAGESTALGNALYYEKSIAAKEVISIDAPIYVNQGERIVVKASAADRITVTIYGIEA